MSKKGNFWGNASVEGPFHSMKVEAIQYEQKTTRDEMRQTIFEHVEGDYNRVKRYRALGYLSSLIRLKLKRI